MVASGNSPVAGVVMILRSVVMSAVLLIGAGSAVAETINTPTCRQDLAATWSKMEGMLVRPKSASRAAQTEKGGTNRQPPAGGGVRGREVFERWKAGRERVGDVGEMEGALDDVNSVIDRECNNGLGPVQPHVRALDAVNGVAR